MKTYDNYVVSDNIDRYIHSERDRELLREHFVNGKSIVKLSKDYDLSYRSIWDIINKGANVLSEYMELHLHKN